MPRKTINVSMKIPVDDGVTPTMIRALLVNHIAIAFSELEGGTAYWDQVRIFVADEGTKL